MAIIKDVPGIEIGVVVAGEQATEYPDPEPDIMPNNCHLSSTYVECLDNQEFCFSYKVDSAYNWGYQSHQLRLKFYIGAQLCSHFCIQEYRTQATPVSGRVQSQDEYNEATKKWYRHKFIFTAVERVDDTNKERIEKDKETVKRLGLLRVEVARVTIGRSRNSHKVANTTQKPGSSKDLSSGGIPQIAEKALKGKEISHGANLGEGEPIEHKPPSGNSGWKTWSKTLPEDNGPIAVFLFKYRSKEALKNELIIPRSPSPLPIPGGHSEFEDKKPSVKREHGNAFDLDEASVKSRRKRPKPDGDDEELPVVDLTGED